MTTPINPLSGHSFWKAHSIADVTPDHNDSTDPAYKSAGHRARENELSDAENEARQSMEMSNEERPGMGLTGTVHNTARVKTAQKALKRQQQYEKGEYPSGQ